MVDHRLLPLILLLNEYPPLVVLHSIMINWGAPELR